jgi:hypothetical protein
MEPLKPSLEPGTASINGAAATRIIGVKFDYRTFEIQLKGRECININCFSSKMLAVEAKRIGSEHYTFEGPKLGFYHDTVDIREGPYVNHYINHLEIFISYPSRLEASFVIKGSCDLSKSYIDPYGRPKVATSGDWIFEVTFTHRFHQP